MDAQTRCSGHDLTRRVSRRTRSVVVQVVGPELRKDILAAVLEVLRFTGVEGLVASCRGTCAFEEGGRGTVNHDRGVFLVDAEVSFRSES